LRLKLTSVLLIGLVAIVAAGCGGSKKETSATTTAETTTTETTTAEDTTAAETTTEDDSSAGGGGFASSKNCLELLNLSASFAKAFAATENDDLDTTAKFFQEVADKAPGEIKADFQIIAKAFTAYAKALVDAGLKPGAQPTPEQIAALTKAAESFSVPEVTKASERISAWSEKNCPS